MQSPKLVSITKMEETMTPEESIVYMARVSNPENQGNHDTSLKLLTYLVEQGHWSPFSMVDMTVEIYTSRAIMAQILRHYSFTFQERSQRYSNVDLIDWSHLEARVKPIGSNRQSSEAVDTYATNLLKQSCKHSECNYQELLAHGIASESARMALPLSTPTRAYMKGSVRSWITYFWQRLDHHAQKEHRELAEEIFTIFESKFPNIAIMIKRGKSAYVSNNWKDKQALLEELYEDDVLGNSPYGQALNNLMENE